MLLKKSGKLNIKMIKTSLNFMSKNISGHLAKAAIPFRWLSIVLTILIFFITKNNQSSTEWSTGLTAAGALLGVYGAWLTLEIFKIGDTFGQQQQKLIEEVHSTVMTGAKTQHMHELRRKYEEAKTRNDDHAERYWHFIWRFESYDFLGLSLEPNGYARVRILGINNPAFETSYQKLENPIYTVEVYEVLENTELKMGRAFCSSINGSHYISNSANEIELYNPRIKFQITGLGPISGGAVRNRPPNFRRLKDLRNPSSGNEDQG